MDAGWDGETPILTVCPINPFWWPVTPSVPKFLAHACFGAYKESYYRTIYFHKSGSAVDAAYKKYLAALAQGVKAFRSRHRVFLVLIAMESLDTRACDELAPQLDGAPVFSADDYDMYQLVSILRCSSLIVSSRYHAMVTSMPSLVPSAGVTMDERIRNLLRSAATKICFLRLTILISEKNSPALSIGLPRKPMPCVTGSPTPSFAT